jgi:hypothetical protein
MTYGPTLPLRDAMQIVDKIWRRVISPESRHFAVVTTLCNIHTDAYCAGVADARLDIGLMLLGFSR